MCEIIVFIFQVKAESNIEPIAGSKLTFIISQKFSIFEKKNFIQKFIQISSARFRELKDIVELNELS